MSKLLLIASTAAEAHLAVAQHALEEAQRLIESLGAAEPNGLRTEVHDATITVRKIRAKLDILRKRIP